MTQGEMEALVERLRLFEGSDALGDGDFSVCTTAANTIEALVRESERHDEDRLRWAKQLTDQTAAREKAEAYAEAARLLGKGGERELALMGERDALKRECERLSVLINGTTFVAVVDNLEAERDALAAKAQKMEAVVEAARKYKRGVLGDGGWACDREALFAALTTLDGDKW